MTVTRFELEAARLVIDRRWAALATQGDDGYPSASMVAYAWVRDLSNLLVFVSGLSEHTRNLIKEPRVALVISQDDTDTDDPQTLARVSVTGRDEVVERNSPEFADVWQMYIEQLPAAAPRIVLGDFLLIRIVVSEVRYVGGFAQAHTIPAGRLSSAALEF
jgi:putative heme iron utilization protein